MKKHESLLFRKDDSGKPEFELLPFELLSGVNKILQYGRDKYGIENWKKDGFQLSRAYNALFRHMIAFWNGEDIDKESGLSHLDHAMCNLLFMKYHLLNKPESDNRPCKQREKYEQQ